MARTKQTARKSAGGKSVRGVRRAPIEAGGIKKAHRWRPGTAALREIRKLQKTTNVLIRKAPFQRIVREVAQDFKEDTRWTRTALLLTQEITEAFLIGLLSNAQLAAIHCKRQGVKSIDVELAKAIMIKHPGLVEGLKNF
jgi:histone H3